MMNFDPLRHGFHFRNDFVNVVFDLFGLRLVTRGRCGGMAYVVLDYYAAGRVIPVYTCMPECAQSTDLAGAYDAEAYRLARTIYRRQLDSMIGVWPFGRALDFVTYTLASDSEVFRWTVEREVERLKQCLQAGVPVPLGLIGVHELLRIGENHQVVAYAYEQEQDVVEKVSIYDSNHPDEYVSLLIDREERCVRSSTGRVWRGFFVRDDYRPATRLR